MVLTLSVRPLPVPYIDAVFDYGKTRASGRKIFSETFYKIAGKTVQLFNLTYR